MRRLRDDATLVKVDRPFAVWVEEAYDLPGVWVAHIAGHNLDNVTQGNSPQEALFMAYDVLKILTGYCSSENPEHDFSIDSAIVPEDGEVIPAYECSRCHEKWARSEFEEDDGPDLQP